MSVTATATSVHIQMIVRMRLRAGLGAAFTPCGPHTIEVDREAATGREGRAMVHAHDGVVEINHLLRAAVQSVQIRQVVEVDSMPRDVLRRACNERMHVGGVAGGRGEAAGATALLAVTHGHHPFHSASQTPRVSLRTYSSSSSCPCSCPCICICTCTCVDTCARARARNAATTLGADVDTNATGRRFPCHG